MFQFKDDPDAKPQYSRYWKLMDVTEVELSDDDNIKQRLRSVGYSFKSNSTRKETLKHITAMSEASSHMMHAHV